MNNKKAFTLIELVVVIAIIGILTAVVATSLNTPRKKSRDAKRIADLKQIQLALEAFAEACGGRYPTVSTLATNSSNASCPNGVTLGSFIASIPLDPSTGGVYTYVPTTGGSAAACYGYHLGSPLETNNSVLWDDADAAASASLCGVATTDFNGLSAVAAPGACDANPGTARSSSAGTETCYDLRSL